jgi:phage shock protein A
MEKIAAYRREIEAEREELRSRVERILGEGRDLDARLDRLTRSTAEWSLRAGEAGMDRAEVLRLLGLEHPKDVKSPPLCAPNSCQNLRVPIM